MESVKAQSFACKNKPSLNQNHIQGNFCYNIFLIKKNKPAKNFVEMLAFLPNLRR